MTHRRSLIERMYRASLALYPRAFRDRVKARGILTAGGLGPFENAGFRIGHMGDIRIADVDRTLDAVKAALNEMRATEVPSRSATASVS